MNIDAMSHAELREAVARETVSRIATHLGCSRISVEAIIEAIDRLQGREMWALTHNNDPLIVFDNPTSAECTLTGKMAFEGMVGGSVKKVMVRDATD